MSDFLLYYSRPNPTTWVYMSSFLTIGLFFIFRRFWSIRNLDIFLLILLAPGLLIVHEGYRQQLVQSELLAAQLFEAAKQSSNQESTLSSAMLTGALPVLALVDEDTDTDTSADRSPDDGDDDGLDQVEQETAAGSSETSMQPEDEAKQVTPLEIQRVGFVYLFIVEALILIRLMLDPLMVRRPLLDPNLTSGGLTFIGISMFIFMMANVVNSDSRNQVTQGPALGPGYALMNMLPAIPTRPISEAPGGASPQMSYELTSSQLNLARIAKTLAIAAQLAIVTGIVLIANRHFGNLQAGVGCATLYLMLPYTAQMTGRVDHVVPAALLLWAILSYRRPIIAGVFMGLACGLVYYPLFLLPLWFSFYWQRGSSWISYQRHRDVGTTDYLFVVR